MLKEGLFKRVRNKLALSLDEIDNKARIRKLAEIINENKKPAQGQAVIFQCVNAPFALESQRGFFAPGILGAGTARCARGAFCVSTWFAAMRSGHKSQG